MSSYNCKLLEYCTNLTSFKIIYHVWGIYSYEENRTTMNEETVNSTEEKLRENIITKYGKEFDKCNC